MAICRCCLKCHSSRSQPGVLPSRVVRIHQYDLCKIGSEVFHCRPRCEFVFDSLTVGRQSEGRWQAACAVADCHVIRSVIRLCEQRFHVDIGHHFCPGHAGEPGNELVRWQLLRAFPCRIGLNFSPMCTVRTLVLLWNGPGFDLIICLRLLVALRDFRFQ